MKDAKSPELIEEERKEKKIEVDEVSDYSKSDNISFGSSVLSSQKNLYTANLPKMKDLAGMDLAKVAKWISLVRHSYYHKIHP